MNAAFAELQRQLSGDLYWSTSMQILYATDASAYREMPQAVAHPKTSEDIQKLIAFARHNSITLIPRAAGTSLAGQVVGNGLVVDISRYMTHILEINAEEQWVRVQPGVIRDDLNKSLQPYGLFFGPETSTANRAMIGGMVGNNSCGLHSIVWGTTRDHILEVRGFLSDGSEVIFSSPEHTTNPALNPTQRVPSLEKKIYEELTTLLTTSDNQHHIRKNFPKPSIRRRNTGYALDVLLDLLEANPTHEPDVCKLIAGSEGTLMFLTEITLNLLPLPPQERAVVCVHCHSIHESLQANLIAMQQHAPMASELVDKYILDFTKGHPEYDNSRFFIEGDPKAILMVEFMEETPEQVHQRTMALITDLQKAQLGFAYPVIRNELTQQVWDIRKAGLGLIRNLPGDTQPVNLIEDCAVDVADLPAYIAELEILLQKKGLAYSMYAHAGAGELHVEPLINLKTTQGHTLFREVLAETAALVKKYNGSLSGEHGDGRLRGEFISFMMGQQVYDLFKQIKQLFDPNGVFNAGKIIDTPPMHTHLRYDGSRHIPDFQTVFDFSNQEGILHLTEKCSGSGDCRKTHLSGGTMCPSYMATRNEKDTTRARANILREFLTHSSKENRFDHLEIKQVMDLCLSCKACKAECPSNVDVAKLKAEFLQHYYDANGVPFRSWLVANFTRLTRLASLLPWAYNALYKTAPLRKLANRIVGFHPQRGLPLLHKTTLRGWFEKQPMVEAERKVYLFCDEFTNYNDVPIGQTAIRLLQKLGYQVILPHHLESGRTYLSKGLLREAKKIAHQNVELLSGLISAQTPLIGLEPSAILTFRDEYPELVDKALQPQAEKLAANVFLIEEFLASELDKKQIRKEQFTKEKRLIKLHGHCQQKAMSSLVAPKKLLSVPENYQVQLIPSGCCGMAGSFGYEKEHYELSMQIGELVLFPTVRQQPEEVLIAAAGTSCRHQIHEGTGRTALHPVEILWQALL